MDNPDLRFLTDGQVQGVLYRLYAETLEHDPLARARAAEVGLNNGAQDGFYAAMGGARMPVTPDFGRLLFTLARSAGARVIVEFGTSFGVSTIFLAAALRANGGGLIVTTELLPEKAHAAEANLKAAGLESFVEVRVGDAQTRLASGLPKVVDLVLLDAAKELYLPLLRLLEPRLRPGSLVVSDRSDLGANGPDPAADFLSYLQDPAHGYVSSAIASRALGSFHPHVVAIRL